MDADQREIWAAVRDMYDAFLAGDRVRVDRHMLADATVWDAEWPALARGRAELDAIRAARPTGPDAPTVVDMATYHPVIDVWGEFAVARHVFVVHFADPAQDAEVVRNTSVWRRVDGAWRIAHNHEDVLPAPAGQEYLRRL